MTINHHVTIKYFQLFPPLLFRAHARRTAIDISVDSYLSDTRQHKRNYFLLLGLFRHLLLLYRDSRHLIDKMMNFLVERCTCMDLSSDQLIFAYFLYFLRISYLQKIKFHTHLSVKLKIQMQS